MLIGMPPFYHSNIDLMYKKIVENEVICPLKIKPDAKDLIEKLLNKD